MNTPPKPHRSARAILLVVLACVACRAPAAVAAQPPRSHLEPAGGIVEPPPSAAVLGLTLTRASVVLRQQLALKRGAGLVVDTVAAGSPAARCGFAQHDVLVTLDDQLLLLPEQFAALLEAAERDTPLDCTVLRAGREVVIPLAQGRAGAPRAAADGGGLRPTSAALALVRTPASPSSGPVAAELRQLSAETLMRRDADCQIRLVSGDETRLVVTDSRGRVLFDDAIDTPAGRSRMPPTVRDRVAEMERLLETRRQAASTPAADPAAPVARTAEIGRLDVDPIELR
jgi:hypothetical protein